MDHASPVTWFTRRLRRPLGRRVVQSLVVLLTLTGVPPEPVLRALHWEHSPLGRIAQRLAELSHPNVLAQPAAVVPNPDFAAALWLTASTGLRKLTAGDGTQILRLATETTLQPLALDAQRGRVWSYRTNTLKALTFAGQLVLTVPVPSVSGGDEDDDDDDDGENRDAQLAVHAPSGSVRLGRGTPLLHLSANGQLLHTLTLPTTIRALAVDSFSGRLWVATPRSGRAYDEQGALVSTLSLGTNPTVRALAVDSQSGAVWVALAQRLRRYTASGQQDLDLPLSARRVTSDGDRSMADDGHAGATARGHRAEPGQCGLTEQRR